MGWDSGRYPEQLKRGMEHSSQVISAWDGDKFIGLVRGLMERILEKYKHQNHALRPQNHPVL